MKKKVDNKSVFALTALICILGVFLVYLFGYKKLEETATRLTAENNEIATIVDFKVKCFIFV